jgi:hypothetical protein
MLPRIPRGMVSYLKATNTPLLDSAPSNPTLFIYIHTCIQCSAEHAFFLRFWTSVLTG